MIITLEDGSELQFEEHEAATLIELGILPKPKTLAEKVRDQLDEIAAQRGQNTEIEDESVIPDAVPEPKTPAVMPKHVELPPTAFVTQAQALIIELLRHHPLGLETKRIAELLRWTHTKTSSQMSRLMIAEAAFTEPVVEKVAGHRRYKLTDFGRRCRYEIEVRPAHRRDEREPERFGDKVSV